MDLKSLFGGVSVGRDTSGNIKVSFVGDKFALAIRSTGGDFYIREKNGIKNVTDLTVDAFEGMVLRLPVKEVKEGEIVVLSESPFTAAFIDEVGTGGTVRVAKTDGSVTDFEPPANLLGQRFYVKATNLMESFGSGGGDKNLLLLMLLLGKGDSGTQSDSLLPFLLLQLGEDGSGGALTNPLLLALLLRADKGDWLQTLLLMQALGGGVLGGGSGGSSLPPARGGTAKG
jgi:hypothetical protein